MRAASYMTDWQTGTQAGRQRDYYNIGMKQIICLSNLSHGLSASYLTDWQTDTQAGRQKNYKMDLINLINSL